MVKKEIVIYLSKNHYYLYDAIISKFNIDISSLLYCPLLNFNENTKLSLFCKNKKLSYWYTYNTSKKSSTSMITFERNKYYLYVSFNINNKIDEKLFNVFYKTLHDLDLINMYVL